jgi:hypothetical protein
MTLNQYKSFQSSSKISNVRQTLQEFIASLTNTDDFANLKNPKTELIYKNIIPIRNLLTKAFLDLPKKDPISVAMKFLETMLTYNTIINDETNTDNNAHTTEEPDIVDDSASSNSTTPNPITKHQSEKFLPNFIHVIQFCQLCFKGKITPVHYKIISTDEVNKWFNYVLSSCNLDARQHLKHLKPIDLNKPDSDNNVNSPEHKSSKTD